MKCVTSLIGSVMISIALTVIVNVVWRAFRR